MSASVACEQRASLSLGGRLELVLFRYPWARSGEKAEGCETVEGYIRTRPLAYPRAWRRPSLRNLKRSMADLTHVDPTGKARMVDVSGKEATRRFAKASGAITMKPETLDAIRGNSLAKGDVLGVARIAGIMAAKRTADLIPLCHQLPLSSVTVDLEMDHSLPGVRVVASATTEAQTGVEMEAIVAVSVSLITLYDMAKGVDKGMQIGEISLVEKRGGKSGDWVRNA
jgi:cyclic pyranopterin monophosphate synthase